MKVLYWVLYVLMLVLLLIGWVLLLVGGFLIVLFKGVNLFVIVLVSLMFFVWLCDVYGLLV